MNIAICDDSLNFLPIIKNEVENELSKNKLKYNINIYDNSRKLLEATTQIKYDLLFLDIDMPNLTGIELVQNYLKDQNLCIVFVTNRDDLVFDALKCQPINFIRKQHLCEELPLVISSFIKRFMITNQFIDFTINKIIKRVKTSDILYIESQKHYINVVCNKSSESFTTKASISKIESELHSPSFCRIHVGYLVNTWHITQIGNNSVTLDNGVELPVSRYRMEETKMIFHKSRRYLL